MHADSAITGRNGGHFIPALFPGFVDYASIHGKEEAVRSAALEDHTINSMVELIRDTGKAKEVDLVNGGHVAYFLTEAQKNDALADYTAAKKAGVEMYDTRFLTKEEAYETYGAAYPAVQIGRAHV